VDRGNSASATSRIGRARKRGTGRTIPKEQTMVQHRLECETEPSRAETSRAARRRTQKRLHRPRQNFTNRRSTEISAVRHEPNQKGAACREIPVAAFFGSVPGNRLRGVSRCHGERAGVRPPCTAGAQRPRKEKKINDMDVTRPGFATKLFSLRRSMERDPRGNIPQSDGTKVRDGNRRKCRLRWPTPSRFNTRGGPPPSSLAHKFSPQQAGGREAPDECCHGQ